MSSIAQDEILALGLEGKLDALILLFQNLPIAVPLDKGAYKFHRYKPGHDEIADTGSYQGAVLKHIESVFGPLEMGPYVNFQERGDGLDGLATLLRMSINDTKTDVNMRLLKWLDTFLVSAMNIYGVHSVPIPPLKRVPRQKVVFSPQVSRRRESSAAPSRAGSRAPSRAGSTVPSRQGSVIPMAESALEHQRVAAVAETAPTPTSTSPGHEVIEIPSSGDEGPARARSSHGRKRVAASDDDDEGQGANSSKKPGAPVKRARTAAKNAVGKRKAANVGGRGKASPVKRRTLNSFFGKPPGQSRVQGKQSVAQNVTEPEGTGKDGVDSGNGLSDDGVDSESEVGMDESFDDEPAIPSQKDVRKARSNKRNARLWKHNPDDLTDCDEPPVKTTVSGQKLGRPALSIVRRLTIPCMVRSTGQRRYRCSQGECRESFSSRQKERVLPHHINACDYIDAELRAEAIAAMSKNSLAERIAKAEGRSDDADQPADGDADASGLRQMTLKPLAEAAGRRVLQDKFDYAVMQLWSSCGLAGHILDLRLWENLVKTANPRLETFSSTTLHDIHIAQEAVRVRQLAVKHLQQLDNLTISYDGGTTHLVESIYTVHVTAPETRESYFMAGNESSGLSHTAEYIAELALKVMREIGEHLFICVISDSTGSTRKARKLIADAVETLLTLADAPHHLNLTIGDICALVYFAVVISNSRLLIRFFHLSSFGTQRLKSQAQIDGVGRHLETIGKTRFASLNRAAHSILRNLPSIKQLVEQGVIFTTAKERRTYAFLRSASQYNTYDLTLRQLAAVLTPLAKALKCLESSLVHPGHVLLFWLAALATIQALFDANEESLELPNDVIDAVRSILNLRFAEMFDGPDNGVYKAALFLDPEYLDPALWQPVPTDGAASTVPRPSETDTRRADDDLRKAMPCYAEIGQFLSRFLMKHVEAGRAAVFKEYAGPKAIARAFQLQFPAYARREYPFSRDTSRGWRQYWAALEKHPDANILAFLAKKLLSMLPNSMAEERTMSALTKAQEGRPRMKVSSLVAEVQVKQHTNRTNKVEKRVVPSISKFRDLPSKIKSEVLSCPEDTFTYPSASSQEATASEPGPAVASGCTEHFAAEFNAVERQDAPTVSSGSSNTFDIAAKINLKCALLLDQLSDSPVTGAASSRTTEAPNGAAPQAARAEEVIDENDFDFGD